MPGDTTPAKFANGTSFSIPIEFQDDFPIGDSLTVTFTGPDGARATGQVLIPLFAADRRKTEIVGNVPWTVPPGLYRATEAVEVPIGGHPTWKLRPYDLGDREDLAFIVEKAEPPADPQPPLPRIVDPDK